MRALICTLSIVSLAGCTSMGGVLSSETTWFQDWSCERQDGVCARTDTIDTITISELDNDSAEAGPVSGYPAENLPLIATPKKLRGIQPRGREHFDSEIERAAPFLETSFGEEELAAAPALLSEPAFSIDAAFQAGESSGPKPSDDLFESAFPDAAISAQLAVLQGKLGLAGPDMNGNGGPPVDAKRITRTVIRRDGVLVPEEERVTERVELGSAAINADPIVEISNDEQSLALQSNSSLSPRSPHRSDAKVLPVIISPYVDARGNFHERSVIWVEVEPADWVVE